MRTMKFHPLVTALAVTATILAGCGDDGEKGNKVTPAPTRTATPTPAEDANLRVIHGSPDAPNVDVLLDGAVVLSDVPYLAASEYLTVAAGIHNIQVRATGSEIVVIDEDVALDPDTDYTVVATDFRDSITPVVLVDDRTAPDENTARVRVGHGAPSAPNVDVYFTAPEGELVDPVLTDVPFQSFSDYLTVASGDYRVRVTPSDSKDVVIDTGTITLDSGDIFTAIAFDAPGGGDPFRVEAYPDSEPTAQLRLVHGSPDAGPVDVLLDGVVVLTDVPYRGASDYLTVPIGMRNVQIRSAGTEAILLDFDVTLGADTDYTGIVTDFLDALNPFALIDDRTLPGEGMTKVRVGHAAPSAPNVDVYVTAPEGDLVDPVLTDVPFQLFSDYLTAPSGDYRVRITPTGSSDVVIDTGTVPFDSNVVLTAIAFDAPGGGAPFSVEFYLDEAA